MSTKTLRKRIALVAVVALGAGVLASAPANAAGDGDMAVTALDYALTTGTIGAAVATDSAQTWTVAQTGKVTITFDAVADGYVQLSGPCYFTGSTLGSGNTLTLGNTRVTTPSTTNAVVTINPTAAGVCIAKSYASAVATTASDKFTLTIVAASSIGALSVSDSFARIESATTDNTGAAVVNGADVAGAERVANGLQGYIGFTLHDSNDIAMPATTVVGCSATGGAVCSFTSVTFLGTSSAATYSGTDYDTIFVAQGVANAAIDTVVTITVNGAVWLTKSFKLLGDVASIELAGGLDGIYGETELTQTSGINLKVKDSLGRLLTSVATTVAASSYNASVTGVGTATTGASTTSGTQVSFTCSATKGSSEIKVSKVNTALATITSNALKVYCVGGAYSYSAALDKAVYGPGDIATLTITAKDSAGNPASDISEVGAAAAIAGSNMTPVTALTSVDTFTAGVKKYTFIVGSTEGSYSMSVSLTDIDDAVTVPYSIKGSGAVSNADVLKAIVSLIASINKQIAALQKALLKR
jgi:hypothetical protein